jgi:uncharacterized RDD family membrane protein YckC
MVYESLLVVAVLFIAALAYTLVRNPQAPGGMLFFQAYLVLVLAGYFIWFWMHGGRTLAMKTWRLRVVAANGGPLSLRQAIFRFMFALIGISCVGVGILWALVDADHQFLHDRLAGTRLVKTD